MTPERLEVSNIYKFLHLGILFGKILAMFGHLEEIRLKILEIRCAYRQRHVTLACVR